MGSVLLVHTLTSECVCPEWQEGQREGEVTHTRVGLEQGRQREENVRQEHWVVTVCVCGGECMSQGYQVMCI